MNDPTPRPRRRRTRLRFAAAVVVVASSVASLAFLAPWLYVRARDPVERRWRDGSTEVVWRADREGVHRGVIREPAGGVPRISGDGITRAYRPVRRFETFWFARTDTAGRVFTPPVNLATRDEQLWTHPGVDLTLHWVHLNPGRIAATLAAPAALWILLILTRLAGRTIARWFPTATWGGPCPQCGYDLRATPSRCPECGWRRRESPGAEEVAARLSEVE